MVALGPSAKVQPIPYGLVSLWDMINFNVHALLLAHILIRQEYSLAAKAAKASPGTRLSAADQSRLRGNVQGIARPLRALFIADDRLNTVFNLVEHRGDYAELAHELKALASDVLDATRYERFYHYPRDKGLLVLRVPGDWAATLKAFPISKEDVEAAVDCYAFERHRASIHHLMMVLEEGLLALATKLKVKFKRDRSTWAPLIDDIRRKIDEELDKLAKPPKGTKPLSPRAHKKRKEFLEACQEAALDTRYFKNVWRDHVSHKRQKHLVYDENDAKKVLDHVRGFMEIVSTKLKLKEIT